MSKHFPSVARRFRAALALSTLALAAIAPSSAARAEDRALIIGIDKYSGTSENGGPTPLAGPVNDAKMMYQVATKALGFKESQVRALLDEQATVPNIMRSMEEWLIAGTKPGDRVFLFFSGHGTSLKPAADDPNQDKRIQAIVAYSPPGQTDGYLVYDKNISDVLKKLPDREILVVVDSCFSGTVTRSSSSGKRVLGPLYKLYEPTGAWLPRGTAPSVTMRGLSRNEPGVVSEHPNVISITAVTSSQLSQIDVTAPADSGGYSVFAKRLFDGFVDRKADRTGSGKITVTQLFDYARDETTAYCDANSKQCNEHNSAAPGMTPELEVPDKWRALDLLKWGGAGGGGSPDRPTSTEPAEVLGNGNVPPPQVVLSAEGGIVKLGSQIKVGVKSQFKGFVIVLDLRDDGKVAQLFPSKVCRRPNRAIRPDAPLIMPDPTYGCAFSASEVGKGRIVVVVSEDDVPIEALLNQSKDTVAVKDGPAFMAKLSKALNSTWRKDVNNRSVKWSMAEVRYEVRK